MILQKHKEKNGRTEEGKKEGKDGGRKRWAKRKFSYRIAANKYTKNNRIENPHFITPNKITDLGKGH